MGTRLSALLGNNNKKAALTPKEAIQRLKEIQTEYERRSDYIEARQNNLRSEAKQLLRDGKRETARLRLQLARNYAPHLRNIQKWHNTITALCLQLESTVTAARTVDSIREASKTLGQLVTKLDAKNIDSLIDDVSEHVQVSNQMLDTISHAGEDWQAASGLVIDDDELERELDELARSGEVIKSLPKPPPPAEDTSAFRSLEEAMKPTRPLVSVMVANDSKKASQKQPLLSG